MMSEFMKRMIRGFKEMFSVFGFIALFFIGIAVAVSPMIIASMTDNFLWLLIYIAYTPVIAYWMGDDDE